MSDVIRHIEACLAALGRDDFVVTFLDLVEALDADQIMVFAIRDDHASCLISRHFGRLALGEHLASKYLTGWFRADPLLAELLEVPAGEVRLRRLADFAGRMSPDYRRIFFDAPGLTDKVTLLAAGQTLRLFVNLYRSDAATEPLDEELARLVGRLTLMHFDRQMDEATPPPLAALSERERAVCLGILAGKKAELIAGELQVAPSTVVTYRKRAYDKLGIRSRAGLFAICGR